MFPQRASEGAFCRIKKRAWPASSATAPPCTDMSWQLPALKMTTARLPLAKDLGDFTFDGTPIKLPPAELT